MAAIFAQPSPAESNTLVVIGRRDSEVDKLSAEQVSRIYLKQSTTLPSGSTLEPLDLREGSPLYVEFYGRITGKSPPQIRAYWARQAFSGMGIAPRQVASPAEAIKILLKNPGTIAYIQKRDLEDGLKVLLDTGK